MSEARSDVLEVDGQKLECAWIGPRGGAGPTLVFLHEGLGCVGMWRDFPARLAERTGLPAFLYSRLGYGRSDPCALPRPVRFMHHEGLDVLPKALAAAGLDDVILVGHSDGASISIVYAGAAPRAGLRGLVLEAPHVFNEPVCVESATRIAERFREGDFADRLRRYHGDNTEGAFWGWNEVWLDPEFLRWNIEEYLPGINVPLLVIQGEDDEYGTMRQVDAICAQAGGTVEPLKLPDCGHSPHRDQQARVLDAMEIFIRDRLL